MKTRTSASVEEAAEHIQHRIDGAPRDVAPYRSQNKSLQIELPAFREQACPAVMVSAMMSPKSTSARLSSGAR